jgi:Ferritin-like domain
VPTYDVIQPYPPPAGAETGQRGAWTRSRLLRAALGGGAVAAGGAALGRWGGGAPLAAPSKDTDAKILGLFLVLERAQLAFYRAALAGGKLTGELHAFATAAARQESHHVAFLAEHAGATPAAKPRSDFGSLLASPQHFQTAAIELEEATIAAYIGQGANLRRETLRSVATLVSVEARQVAWIRDIAGVLPAPQAADPARAPQAVLADLRQRGFLS